MPEIPFKILYEYTRENGRLATILIVCGENVASLLVNVQTIPFVCHKAYHTRVRRAPLLQISNKNRSPCCYSIAVQQSSISDHKGSKRCGNS